MADEKPADQPKPRRTTKTTTASATKSARKPAAKPRAAAKAQESAAKTKAVTPRAATPKKRSAPRKKPVPRKSAATKASEPAKAASAAATAAVERAVTAVKRAVPDVPPRAGIFAALGTAAVAAGAFFVWRASRAEEPHYQTVESDGPIEVRKYPALVSAGTEHRGQRRAALDEGFRTLADYIFAKSRPGARLPMTAPVLSDTDGDGSWRTRFLMPTGKARGELPVVPSGVELISEPARRVAALRFSGRADDADLQAKEGALRSWLQIRGLPHEGKAVHAFYNAPFLPGALRRNEVMVVLSEEGGTGAA